MDEALVSIGIPTFNRPIGLKRTIDHILNQSYRNIEIIISDNCSQNPEVRQLLEHYKVTHSRIKIFYQQENLGQLKNFQFVLKESSGEFFMWAADDDEWDPDFIKDTLPHIQKNGGAILGHCVFNRKKNTQSKITMPELDGLNVSKDIVTYLYNPPPSFFYGLYKRPALLFFLNEPEFFDFIDFYIILRIMIYDGFSSKNSDKVYYYAGIDTDEYVMKPAHKNSNKLFSYKIFYRKILRLIWIESKLGISSKFRIALRFHRLFFDLIIGHEKKHRNHFFILSCVLINKILVNIERVYK